MIKSNTKGTNLMVVKIFNGTIAYISGQLDLLQTIQCGDLKSCYVKSLEAQLVGTSWCFQWRH